MAHYTRKELAQAIHDVGCREGDVVFSHSNIGFFGVPEGGMTAENVFSVVYGAFLDVIGPSGTLVVPTFTYSFCKGQDFDPDNTPSTCGAFTEMLRRLPGALRSEDPLFSVAALGRQAREMTRDAPLDCFGPNSFWDRFLGAGGMVCNLNLDAGSTYIHFVEKSLAVPYRYDKPFSGTFLRQGCGEIRTAVHYCCDLSNPDAAPAFEPFDRLARERGMARSVGVGRGAVVGIRAEAVFALLRERLARDPWFLTSAGAQGRDLAMLPPEPSPCAPAIPAGASLSEILAALDPLPRYTVSRGCDDALSALAGLLPMEIASFPTGTRAFSRFVPERFTCLQGRLETLDGKPVLDVADGAARVPGYTASADRVVSRGELFAHLYVDRETPDPVWALDRVRERDWGLACTARCALGLRDAAYRVRIGTECAYGEMRVGLAGVSGTTARTVLLVADLTRACPADGGLSGAVAGMDVLRRLRGGPRPGHGYGLLLVPGETGLAAWLSRLSQPERDALAGALFLDTLGGGGAFALDAPGGTGGGLAAALRAAVRERGGHMAPLSGPTRRMTELARAEAGLPAVALHRLPARACVATLRQNLEAARDLLLAAIALFEAGAAAA